VQRLGKGDRVVDKRVVGRKGDKMGTDQKGVSGKRGSGAGEGRLPRGEGGREEQQGVISEGEGLRQGREGAREICRREGGNSH
jgi:hypothetical protein